MSDCAPLPRSPELMSAADTALLVVDVQEKLIELLPEHRRIVWNIERLLEAAQALKVPIAATEQYPKGLGKTVGSLAQHFTAIPDKVAFSCGACAQIFQDWNQRDLWKVLLVGIETHVCIQQTALDLMAAGYRVYLAVDAVGARHSIDHETALARLSASGAVLTTTESAMFEWCEIAGTPEFKKISALVKQSPPI